LGAWTSSTPGAQPGFKLLDLTVVALAAPRSVRGGRLPERFHSLAILSIRVSVLNCALSIVLS
jgi:hypothetical protein